MMPIWRGRTHMSVTEIARERLGSGCWDRRGSSRRGSLDANNGWINIEMVRTLRRPLSQQQNPNRDGPIQKPELDLLEKDEVKTKRPRMWNIILSVLGGILMLYVLSPHVGIFPQKE